MSLLLAPLMFTDPVVGKDFFGREEVLKLLLKRAVPLRQGYRQNVAVLGSELIGKSSLLQHFMLSFKEKDPETVLAYIEFRSGEPFDTFCRRFAENVLHGHPAPETSLWLKTTLDRCTRNATDRFITLLELPFRLWKETGKHVILILDEFDKLLEFKIEEPFAHLGRQIMVQKETMYLLSSSQVPLARTILSERLSLLFGHFETVILEPFSPKTASEYLEKRWHLSGLDRDSKYFLISLTGGYPFYLNVLGQHLSVYPSGELRNPSKSVIPVLEKVLFSAQGILNHYFTRRLEQFDRSGSVPILQALAKRPHTLQEIRTLKGLKEIRSKLAELLECEIISHYGVFYRISDRLFAFWLRSCFERKSGTLARTISEQSSEFREETQAAIKRFSEFLKKDSHDKLLELFSSFKGEMVEIDQKAHRLPHFSEVRIYNGRKGELTIVGNKEGGTWVSSFFEHEVSEDDVSEFLRQCGRMELPIHQRILIPAGGISENARLLAKKEKLWTWDPESVNTLLDIFGHEPVFTLRGERHG